MSTTEIRNIMTLMESAHNEDLSDALSDIEQEGIEALDDIAAEYGIDPEKLRARWDIIARRQALKHQHSPEARAEREREEANAQRQTELDAKKKEIESKVNPEHVKAIEAFLPTVPTPSSFTREEGHGHMDAGGEVWGRGGRNIFTADQAWVKLSSDTIKIVINISYENDAVYPKKTIPGGIVVSGHTNFKTSAGWKTFSRRGINDSFQFSHFEREKGDLDINALLDEQIKKANARIAEYTDRIIIPGLQGGFSIDPKNVPEITAKLKAGQTHDFMPGGMGTGYTISIRPLQPKMGGFDPSPQGPKELANFFGVPKIYVTSIDAD